MDALPTTAQKLYDEIVDFARAELADPDMRERDAAGTFWRDGWDRCGKFGIMGLPVPSDHGGRGASLVETIAAMDALGYASPDLGLIFSLNAHLWAATIPLLELGTDEQRAHWLPRLAGGGIIGAHAATEPKGGSDVFNMSTTAQPDGDGFIINGTKTFITNAPVCDMVLVYAATNPDAGHLGITAFLIDMDNPGIKCTKRLDTMGLRTSPIGELELTDCRVDASAVLGTVNGGATCFNCSMEWERGCILAMHVGRMRRQLEQCVKYSRTRRQFGQAIGSFQAIANRIVDMQVRHNAARHLVYEIGFRKDRGRGALNEAAVAKLFLSEAAIDSSQDAIQVHGGAGFTRELEFERDLRDAMATRIYSGTVEIHRNLLARLMGLPAS